ncbi:MAG: COX15/CtaA family protein [Proteobacteria bacterium]|nr:COX15/CtaA family protein [Pseudomonadota bacterium]
MMSTHHKPIAAWLFIVSAMVFFMVVLGGVTRLTESGLSMVNWHPVTGWLPPMGQAEWDAVFSAYRKSPEYLKVNHGMSLADFKTIFWYEFLHRLLGRLIGVAFFIPMVVFWIKGWIDRRLAPKLIGLFVLGGLQGVLGWYMVKSGLVDRPDVSQYRLAAHLGLALVILAAMLWVALGLVRPAPAIAPDQGLKKAVWVVLSLITVTALSGAFVAGLDAGHIYNTFPLMDGGFVPDGMFDLSPVYLNFFENITTVQFDHRILAEATFVAIMVFWWRAGRAALTPAQALASKALALVAMVQVGLGIATLLLVVPVPLAALHQTGALVLLCIGVWLAHEFRNPGAKS